MKMFLQYLRFTVVQPGKQANMVVLSANPLQNISNTKRIEAVIVDGRFASR
jgi:imidazolonepropionase-like amidohydrolase